jgi:NAD-dependent SIR2 family protein deacetylase
MLGQLEQFVRRHPRLLVLSGAGVSTACGIPDYRDEDGDWKRAQPVQYGDFVRHPHVRRRYWARALVGWSRFAAAQPGPAHLALARLEELGHVHHLVTQNVDRLHQRAGSRRVIDLHGRLDRVECLDCRAELPRDRLQQELAARNPGFRDLEAAVAPDGDALLEGVDFDAFQVPECDRCGGTLKPAVVFFGESVPRDRVADAFARLEESDAVLVVGSSLMIWSGYRFCRAAALSHKPVAAVNLGRTRADDELALKLREECGAVLDRLVGSLGGDPGVDGRPGGPSPYRA